MREMDSNEDLRAERDRYYERYAFPLFSHIDFRYRAHDGPRRALRIYAALRRRPGGFLQRVRR